MTDTASTSVQPTLKTSTDAGIIKTSTTYKKALDEQVAKYFYATNTPFLHADHPEFIKLCTMLRPGYTPPSRKVISGPMLDSVHVSLYEDAKKQFESNSVTLALDGWSNVHNEPIICFNIIKGDGRTALVQTIDTSGNPHTSDYLQKLTSEEIKRCESEFKVMIGSVVTDNAGNVTKMRRELQKEDDLDIIQYGCNAHILHLLSQDLKLSGVIQPVVKIIKYFRNHHMPAAWFKGNRATQFSCYFAGEWRH